MGKVDVKKIEISDLELEPIEENTNDNSYDGVMHITRYRRQPALQNIRSGKRSAYQSFTFSY